MSEVTVEVEGVEEILKKLRSLPEDLEKNTAKAAMKRATDIVLQTALARVPVGPRHSQRPKAGGMLRASLTSQIRASRGFVTGKVRAKAPHAHLVEYGFVWKRNKNQKTGKSFKVEPSEEGGFLRNALYQNANRIRNEFASSVKESLEKLGK